MAQGVDPKTFRDLLDAAVQFDMKNLLACCEHCIAGDISGKFDEVVHHLPPQSMLRILGYARSGLVEAQKLFSYRGPRWTPQDFLKAE